MNITSSSARAARERRRFAGFVWCAIAIVALLVLMGRKEGGAVVAPGLLFGIPLAGFVTLVSVFAWMLHTSNSGPRGDNPLPMLTGVLTLLPPAVIAYCFVPLGATGHFWPVLGVFVFGTLIMISPLQDELRAAQKTRHMSRLPEFSGTGVESTELSFARIGSSDRAGQATKRSHSPNVDQRDERPSKKRPEPGSPGSPDELPLKRAGEFAPSLRRETDTESPFRRGSRSKTTERDSPSAPPPAVPARRVTSGRDSAASAGAASESSGLSMERMADDYGGELIEGTAVVHFAVGQSRANVHVPFKPPLQGNPEVECEATGDVDLRLKVAMSEPFGLRIEARRRDTSEPLETEIGFAAVYSP